MLKGLFVFQAIGLFAAVLCDTGLFLKVFAGFAVLGVVVTIARWIKSDDEE